MFWIRYNLNIQSQCQKQINHEYNYSESLSQIIGWFLLFGLKIFNLNEATEYGLQGSFNQSPYDSRIHKFIFQYFN